MHGLQDDLPECPVRRERCRCRTAARNAGASGDFTEGDLVFIRDARVKGYLCDEGTGLRAYYRDHDMIHPEVLRREIPSRELTGQRWDGP